MDFNTNEIDTVRKLIYNTASLASEYGYEGSKEEVII